MALADAASNAVARAAATRPGRTTARLRMGKRVRGHRGSAPQIALRSGVPSQHLPRRVGKSVFLARASPPLGRLCTWPSMRGSRGRRRETAMRPPTPARAPSIQSTSNAHSDCCGVTALACEKRAAVAARRQVLSCARSPAGSLTAAATLTHADRHVATCQTSRAGAAHCLQAPIPAWQSRGIRWATGARAWVR